MHWMATDCLSPPKPTKPALLHRWVDSGKTEHSLELQKAFSLSLSFPLKKAPYVSLLLHVSLLLPVLLSTPLHSTLLLWHFALF